MSKKKVLGKEFFDRPTLVVAEDLLGKYLVRKVRGRPHNKTRGKEEAFRIVEVEAYDGPNDKACHASKGRTDRTEIMFGGAGNFYIYFVYGMYWMLNVVVGEKEYPAAVLIRGIESPHKELKGPGKITRHLKIGKGLNGKPTRRASGLWFEDRYVSVPKSQIKRTPRVGVNYAGAWAKKPYRFVLEES